MGIFVKGKAEADHLTDLEREFMELLGAIFAFYAEEFKQGKLKFEITRGVSKDAGKLARGERMLIKPRRTGGNQFVVHIGTRRQLQKLVEAGDPGCWWQWDPEKKEWVLVGDC
jgi:hypothetical protein